MVDYIIERFSERAPAAVLFHGLFARVFSDEQMNQIFRDYKERQIESALVFSSLVHLLTPVVSGGKPTVHACYQEQEEQLGVSCQAVYDKLRRVEIPVSEALVRIPVEELERIRKKGKAIGPDPIPGYHTFVIDGKRLDATEHRLTETRRMKSAPLPGTVLVMIDTRLEMFVDVACDKDAYACERKVVLPILDRLEKGALYLADRNFCDGPLIDRFLLAETFFILRHHGRSPRWREVPGCPLKHVGTDSRGNAVHEQIIEVLLPDGSWHRLRRISVTLAEPTRNNDMELHLLTNLPASVSAIIGAETYHERWSIETCLEYLAQSLNAEINTLAYPGAAILCFCLALVLFNIMSTLKSLLLKHSTAVDKPELSYYYLALEIAETRLGMDIMINAAHWRQYADMSLVKFVSWMKSVAKHAKLRRYRKHPRGPKRPPPKRLCGRRRPHVSSQRIIEARKG
jgi:hypothetical protein